MKPRILIIPGSRRANSLNVALAHEVAKRVEHQGGEPNVVDTAGLALPIYDADHEAANGLPLAAVRLKKAMHEHDGLAFVSPEYNASVPPLMKNAIDWVSRPGDERSALQPFRDKPAVLLSASPGRLGGLRGLRHLREILGALGTLVLPGEFALGNAEDALFAEGEDAESVARSIDNVVQPLLDQVRRRAATGTAPHGAVPPAAIRV